MIRIATTCLGPHPGRAFVILPLFILSLLPCVLSCRHTSSTGAIETTAKPPSVEFKDVSTEAGIVFRHRNGATGEKYLPETMGSGCAFLDFNNDGWLDVILVNSDNWPGNKKDHATLHLYRNDRKGKFEDVTKTVGLDVGMYGMGVAIGDYDNDGFEDIYVTGVGGCRLFHNEGGKYFRDVTKTASVASPGWATSATWIDYDRDGRLDLFVCHYVKWSREENYPYSIDGIHKTYSTPEQYVGESCRLYHNEGGGRFKDVTATAGIENARSKALGVVAFDFDLDGWPDLVTTNDTQPNFLFHNQTDGTFKEVALEAGIAVSEMGKAKAGMGVDVADEQNAGRESIVVTNFSGEQLTLYRPDSSGHYLDEAARSGIGTASQFYLGFGVFFFDFDGDGREDIFVANGHIQGDVAVRQTGVVYREPALLLRNVGNGKYVEFAPGKGSALETPTVGRGAAWGDFDNDGHPDILLSSNQGDSANKPSESDGRARLLKNINKTGNHWLRLRLEGTKSNRDAFGARARIRLGETTLTQIVKGSCGYLSQSDPRLLYGLGARVKVNSLEIQWPSGMVQTAPAMDADRSYFVREGEPPVAEPRGK
jgi:hypothetical protein